MTNPLTCTNVSASDVLVLIVSQYCIKSRMYPVKSWGDADFENQKSGNLVKVSSTAKYCTVHVVVQEIYDKYVRSKDATNEQFSISNFKCQLLFTTL